MTLVRLAHEDVAPTAPANVLMAGRRLFGIGVPRLTDPLALTCPVTDSATCLLCDEPGVTGPTLSS